MSQDSQGEKKIEAAALVAEDRLTDEQIAEQIGISRRTLARWKREPEFQELVQQAQEAFRQKVLTTGIADRVKRVQRLDRDWKRMQNLMEARAVETPHDVPGAGTGLVIRKETETKHGVNIEYATDTGLLAALLAIEQQAAKELGQWTERQDVTSNGETLSAIGFTQLSDAELEQRIKALEGGTPTKALPPTS